MTFAVKPDAKALAYLATVMTEMKIIERTPNVDEYLDLSLVNEV